MSAVLKAHLTTLPHQRKGSMHITIEAGHFYLFSDDKGEPVGFLNEQQQGIALALAIAQELGTAVQFLLFIDDYHGNQEIQSDQGDETIYQQLFSSPETLLAKEYLSQHRIEPLIISELAQTSAAAYLYHQLCSYGVVAKGNRALLPQFDNVSLLTKDGNPTCSLIDAALYLQKIGPHRDAPTITVLPIRYLDQQNQVRNILKAFGIPYPPITIIYHDSLGNEIFRDDWSKEIK